MKRFFFKRNTAVDLQEIDCNTTSPPGDHFFCFHFCFFSPSHSLTRTKLYFLGKLKFFPANAFSPDAPRSLFPRTQTRTRIRSAEWLSFLRLFFCLCVCVHVLCVCVSETRRVLLCCVFRRGENSERRGERRAGIGEEEYSCFSSNQKKKKKTVLLLICVLIRAGTPTEEK